MRIFEIITERKQSSRKVEGGYRLCSKKDKNLGTYPSRAGEEKKSDEKQDFPMLWEELPETLTVQERVSIFSQFLNDKGIINESSNTDEILADLLKYNDDPQPKHKYYVISLVVADSNVMQLGKVRRLTFIKQQPNELLFKTVTGEIVKYPDDSFVGVKQKTFTIEQQQDYGAFKAVILLIHNKNLLEHISYKRDWPFVASEIDEGNRAQPGIPANATDAELRKARKSGGKKGQRAHWLLNMRKGKKK